MNAMKFVPGQPYCGQITPSSTEGPLQGSVTKEDSERKQSTVNTKKQFCPYATVGECRYGEYCMYLHGDACDMCGLQVLYPVVLEPPEPSSSSANLSPQLLPCPPGRWCRLQQLRPFPNELPHAPGPIITGPSTPNPGC